MNDRTRLELLDRLAEAATRALWDAKYQTADDTPGFADRLWKDTSEDVRARYRRRGKAAVVGILTAAARDGFQLVKVPEEMDWRHAEGAAQGFKVKGWNDCRDATLATAIKGDDGGARYGSALRDDGDCRMTAPTLRDVERAICCPSGRCISPSDCYAHDRSRAYPVRINEAAQAVVKLLCERHEGSALRDGDHPV